MSAPGTDPVTPLPPAKNQGDPHVSPSNGTQIEPGTPGRRLPSGTVPKMSSQARHANGQGTAGTYDEDSFGRAPGGLGPWRQA